MSKLVRTGWIALVLIVSLKAEGAPPPEFFVCEAQVNSNCQRYGAPAELIPECSDFLEVCPTYPDGPVINGRVSYVYNCAYTDNSPPYYYAAGIVGACSYAEVRTQYKLVKTVTDPSTGTPVPMADMVTMAPSVLAACGDAPVNSVTRTINLQCVDAITGTAVSGCKVSYATVIGNNNGGHAHVDGRPLGNLTPSEIANADIPAEGLTVTYQAPEVSGDVMMNMTATDPDGASLAVNPTNFHIVNPNTFVPFAVAGLKIVTESHDGQGNYGLPRLLAATRSMTEKYYADPSLGSSRHPLASQAVSLPLGGLFDYHKDWGVPHCAHREGKSIDLSLSDLTIAEQKVLARAAKKTGLHFYRPESPSVQTCASGQQPQEGVCTNHWHASVP